MVDISSIIEGTVKFRDGKKVNWDWDQMKKASNINRTGTKRILFIPLHPLIIILSMEKKKGYSMGRRDLMDLTRRIMSRN